MEPEGYSMKTKILGLEMNRICKIVFAFVFSFLSIGGPAYAQVFTGSISGNVTDSSGATIPGANLRLTQTTTSLVIPASSDESGNFVFPSVDPGDYVLKIEKGGFSSLERTGITLQAGERLALGTLVLTVGTVTQTAEVTGEVATVDTETDAQMNYITSQQVATQLMQGRNVASLTYLLPGVEGGNATSVLDRNGGTFSTEGGRTDANRFMVDGINATDIDNGASIKMPQSADAIAEMTVLQNNYEAEYGGSAGAIVIEVTKSGTNKFHGGVNYYVKNEFFDANSYFNKMNNLPRPRDRTNDINYSIGGPIAFKSFNRYRDKLFFFWNQEFWPGSSATPYEVTVPTDLERSGDFSQSYEPDGVTLRIIKDPTTGLPFPGNKIPADRIDPNGQAILSLFPHANFFNSAVSRNQYNDVGQGLYSAPNRTRTLKIDYDRSTNDRLSFSWTRFREHSEGFSGTAAYFGDSQWPFIFVNFVAENQGLAARWTHTFSTNIVNEAAFSYYRNPEVANTVNPDAPLQSTYNLHLPMLSSAGNPLGYVPGLAFNGVPNAAQIGADLGYFWLPYKSPENGIRATDKLSVLHGQHFMKVGFELWRLWDDIPANSLRFGSYNFTSSSLNPLDTNYDYSNAILGAYQSYQETNGIPIQEGRGGYYDAFVQDTWKALPRLSLDYGLRFEYMIPLTQANNLWATFYPAAYTYSEAAKLYQPGTNASGQRVAVNPITGAQLPQAYIGAIVSGAGVPFDGMVSPALGNAPTRAATDNRGVQVVPRVGFAWNIFGDGKTSVRGGGGVFLTQLPVATYRNRVAQPPLIQTSETFYGTISGLGSAAQALFPPSVLGSNFSDPTPVSYSFNLGVERAMGFGTVLNVSYVGSLDRHLIMERNLNSIPFGTDFLASSKDPTTGNVLPPLLLRPIPGYGDIDIQQNVGTSNYNALQITANRRLGKSVNYQVNYTWSKTMDFGSQDNDTLSTLVPIRIWNYGLSDYDQTHALKANWQWSLPDSHWQNLAAKETLGGWKLSGQAFFLSGTPITPTLTISPAVDIDGSPTDPARLNMTSNPNLARGSRTFRHAFQTSSFALPAIGTYGTIRRNPLRQPGSQTWNLAFFKGFRFTESVNLEIRAEMYNIFNHANFSTFNTSAIFNPSGQQINAGFGQYTATLAPRQMQLGARFSF
jgi:Carboxypeptidase regulatory-like domain